jgi:hypothetical protein
MKIGVKYSTSQNSKLPSIQEVHRSRHQWKSQKNKKIKDVEKREQNAITVDCKVEVVPVLK